MEPHLPQLVVDLAITLGVAAFTTILFRRLKQPVVLGYLLAGIIVGPHVPVPLVADGGNIQTMAELGVILLMFSVGLEFDVRKLAREGLPAVLLGLGQAGLTTWMGFGLGRLMRLGVQESALMGAALSVSSTMIIAKLFEERGGRERGRLRDLVFSVLVVQDLYAILLLAGLDTSSAAAGGGLASALLRVALFLVGVLGVGGLLLPAVLRWTADHGRDETLLVASMGACFACAVLASKAGVSPALGAFAAGMLASASRRVRPIERLVLPVRDMFGAVFFVAVGMLLDPARLASLWLPILAYTAVVLLGSTLGGALGAVLAGRALRTGLRVGLILAQPGELSLVLVGVGSAAGLMWPHALPVVVGVTFLTAILGPGCFRRGESVAAALDRRVPAFVHARLERLRGWPETLVRRRSPGDRPLAAPLAYLLLDALLFNLLLVGMAQYRGHPALAGRTEAFLALAGAALALLAYLAWALLRRAGQMADLVLGPSRPTGAVRFAILAAVCAPALALVQPVLPRAPALALAVGVLLCLAALGRSPGRAIPGSEWLLKRVQRPWETPAPESPPVLASLRLPEACPFNGRPLSDVELALEDLPGVAGVAVQRGGHWLGFPPRLRLQAGDTLVLSGRPAGLEAAEALLGGGKGEDASPPGERIDPA